MLVIDTPQPGPDLNALLLAASRDKHDERLAELYTQAADLEQTCGNIDAMCFYLTHAYVHALQADHPGCDRLQERLVQHGRL